MTEQAYSPQQAVARDVLTAAVATGIAGWARIRDYRWDCPPDQVRADGVDHHDDRARWQITLADVQQALDMLTDWPADCFGDHGTPDPHWLATIPGRLATIRAELHKTGYPLSPPCAALIDGHLAGIVVQLAVDGQVSHP